MIKKSSTKPNPEDVFLLNGEKYEEPVWYYLWVEKPKQPLFKKALANGKVRPEEFGTIVFYGHGDEPPLYYRQKAEKGDFSDS